MMNSYYDFCVLKPGDMMIVDRGVYYLIVDVDEHHFENDGSFKWNIHHIRTNPIIKALCVTARGEVRTCVHDLYWFKGRISVEIVQ